MSRVMRRLFLFLRAMRWGGRLQILVVVLILGLWAWIDFQIGRSAVTIGIVVTSWLIGWLLKPVMVANPRQTSSLLSFVGIVVLAFYVLAWKQWWWKILLAHYAREFVLWLDLSCQYWFLSELSLQRERQAEQFDDQTDFIPETD